VSKSEVRPDYYAYIADDEIDLRELATILVRQWKVIVAVVAAVVSAVAVMNAYFIPPTYESSAVVQFRTDNAALGLDFRAFQALSASPSVMMEVGKSTGVDWSVVQVSERFRFKEENNAPILTVTAKAQDPQTAVRLVQAWIEAVRAETQRRMASRLADQKGVVEANYQAAMDRMAMVEESLARFDQEFPISLMEAQLERDIAKLVADERLLETLKNATIPANEAMMAALKEALDEENVTLDGGVLVQPTGEVQVRPLNPTYLELRRQLVALESTLATDRRRVELLEQELPSLRARVDEARATLIDAKLQRERLVRDLEEARALLEAARLERDEIIALERQLPTRSRVEVISEPMLPDSPVAPRKMLNLALGAMLGGMIAVFGVLLAEWWRSPEGRGRARVG
jgi:Uncharacterized protein involved in exopolysaccharide biosynthesis